MRSGKPCSPLGRPRQRGASDRQFGYPRPNRRFPRDQVLGFLREPPVEIGAAAIAGWRRRLVVALGIASRAGETNMEMIVVSPPRANAAQPGAVGPGLAAQRPLDARIDEDALHLGSAGEGFEQPAVFRPPYRR